ncbi:MAG: hypothetical protein ABEH81_04775 [Halopenitus sp.]
MQHFGQDVVGMKVVDTHGVDIGRITGIEDGYATLKSETGLASRMEAGLSPPEVDGLAIAPEQVIEHTDEYLRLDVEVAEE